MILLPGGGVNHVHLGDWVDPRFQYHVAYMIDQLTGVV